MIRISLVALIYRWIICKLYAFDLLRIKGLQLNELIIINFQNWILRCSADVRARSH